MNDITHTFRKLIALIIISALSLHANAEIAKKHIVMIVSSNGQNQGEDKPGYEFDEFAKAYSVFKENGISVDIASPKGGKVEADKYDAKKPYNTPVLADEAIMDKLSKTLTTASLNAKDYDGIFIVGGKGAMFDLPKDKFLQSLIANIYQKNGSVAAVCHGPAALVNVKLADGSYLIANKSINSFTNQEEKLFGKKWIKQFDFMLEDKLVERGAKFQSSEIMLSHVAVDGKLITGQNPTSTTEVAIALVRNLGLTPIARDLGLEDNTMAVVARILQGEKSAVTEVKGNQKDFHLPLVGMYGFYYLKVSKSDQDYQNALTLMLLAKDAINNPMLNMKIAKTQKRLGQLVEAKNTLKQTLQTKPDYQPAIDMLKSLSI